MCVCGGGGGDRERVCAGFYTKEDESISPQLTLSFMYVHQSSMGHKWVWLSTHSVSHP